MPQFDKLLTGIGPAEAPAQVARRAVAGRLAAVKHYFRQAAAGQENPETIHQLRIWTRRGQAALTLFEPVLPPRASRKLKRTLRKLRRSAAAIRDLDVIHAEVGRALHGPLVRRLEEERTKARRDLRRLLRRWDNRGKLKRQTKRLLARLEARRGAHQDNGVAFGLWCRRQLKPLVEAFQVAARRGPCQAAAGLHRWRLAAKRLRYALELAVVSLPKPIWTRLYQLLSDLQERLGVICDHLVERERLSRFRCESGDAQERRVLDKLAAESRRKLAAAKQGLGRWWTASRRRQVQSLCRRAVAV